MGPKRKPNSIEIFPDHAEIIVNDSKRGELRVLIDLDSVPLIKEFRWYYQSRYIMTRINMKTVFLHYMILPRKEGFLMDHKNRNTLDNRKENFRYATHRQNSWNRLPKNGSTKGVYYSKREQKWKARVVINGKRTLIGSYDTKEESISAYDNIAITTQGEFAATNSSTSHNLNNL